MNRDECLLAFSSISNLQMDIIRKLLDLFDGPEAFFELSKSQLEKVISERKVQPYVASQLLEIHQRPPVSRLQKEMTENKINFITDSHPDFPKSLLTLKEAPLYLFYKGKLPQNDKRIAIIGARNCSLYGKEIAICFSKVLARCGLTVVSGMARGVDGYAHEGAISGKGKTIAVLGFGIDQCYPKENYGLMQRIAENGCLISEYAPGTQAKPLNFPARNRLIAGMSDGLLVIEAAKKSGTLITVDYALEQGKNIYTIPGRIGDPLSAGCNELIKNGCTPITEPQDILTDFGYTLDYASSSGPYDSLDENSKKILNCADKNVKYTNDFAAETGIHITEVIKILYELEMKKLILQPLHGGFVKAPNSVLFS